MTKIFHFFMRRVSFSSIVLLCHATSKLCFFLHKLCQFGSPGCNQCYHQSFVCTIFRTFYLSVIFYVTVLKTNIFVTVFNLCYIFKFGSSSKNCREVYELSSSSFTSLTPSSEKLDTGSTILRQTANNKYLLLYIYNNKILLIAGSVGT